MTQPVFSISTWHDCLVAGHALGGELVAVAVAAHQSIFLAGEGLVGQRAVAAETAETVRVVMSVLVEELLEEEEREGHTEHLEMVKNNFLFDQRYPIKTLIKFGFDLFKRHAMIKTKWKEAN